MTKEQFKAKAREILIQHTPITEIGVNYMIKVKEFMKYRDDLGNKIMAINAPNIDEDTKKEIAEWAKEELTKYIQSLGEKSN